MEIYADDIVAEHVLLRSAMDGAATARRTSAERQTASRWGASQWATSRWAFSRWITLLSFLAADVVAVMLLLAGSHYLPRLAGVDTGLPMSHLGLVAGLLLGGFAVAGLYHHALTMHPVQEVRVAAMVILVIFSVCGITLWITGAAEPGALAMLGLSGGLALLVIPLVRATSRILFAKADWWGAPVLIVASGSAGRAVVRNLKCWPELGLRPVAVVQKQGSGEAATSDADAFEGVPVLRERDAGTLAPKLMSAYHIPYAIVSRPDLKHHALAHLLRRCSRFCQQVFVVPERADAPALWTGPQAFQSFLGYGVRHTDYGCAAQRGKRAFDILGALLALTVLAPVFLVIAVLIKLESSGPVFFRQLRIGRQGRCFSCLKFRSMHVNAAERLEEVLQSDPALRAEYETYHKLKDDPRVARIGAFLRKYSLDELPQLWNVLKGEMSLVGPRAYTPNELSDMQDFDRIITQSRPGLSGLWQVSGRNALSFEERTRLDVHYIHHWSLALDFYILARTLPAVFEIENAS